MKRLLALFAYIGIFHAFIAPAYSEYHSDQSSKFYLNTAHLAPANDGYDSAPGGPFFCNTAPPLVVSTITCGTGIDTGSITVTISGNNFDPAAVVILVLGSQTICGTNTIVISTYTLTTTFDLTNIPGGTWSIMVINPDGNSGTLTDVLVIPDKILPVTPITITTDNLPAGFVGASYTGWLTVTGGLNPYTWEIISGSLPKGLFLSSDSGKIWGKPEMAGQANFLIRVRDSQSPPALDTKSLAITINSPATLNIITSSLPEAQVASAYLVRLMAGGGLPPYTWRITSGSLPPGLFLNSQTGEILGSPENPGEYSVEVQVEDNQSFPARATKNLVITTKLISGFNLNRDAPSFANTQNILWPYSEKFPDWEIYSQAFGKNQVEWANGTKRPGAALHWQNIRQPFTGSPFGFTLASLLFYSSLLSPGGLNLQYANNIQDVAHIIPGESSRPIINKYQLFQYGQQFRQYLVQTYSSHQNLQQMLEETREGVISNPQKNRGIAIWNPHTGHAVVPYQIETSPGLCKISVYDCNQPLNQERFITINTQKNSWFYNVLPGDNQRFESDYHLLALSSPADDIIWPGQQGNEAQNIALPPVDFFLNPPHLPGPYAKNGYINLFIQANSDVVIQDSQGNSIGYLNNALINNLPGAIPIIPINNRYYARPPEYYLPDNSKYLIKVVNTPGEAYQITLFGQESIFNLLVGTAAGGSNDYLYVSRDKFTYTTGEVNRDYSAVIVVPENEREMVYKIGNTSISKGGTVTFELIDNRSSLKYISEGNPQATYDLTLELSNETPGSFTRPSINLGEDETHIISPQNWENLNQDKTNIQIDEDNDGRIDRVLELREESQTELRAISGFNTYNYPNPFDPNKVPTTIRCDVPGTGTVLVEIAIYNLSGQKIWTASASKTAGYSYYFPWEGKNDEGEIVSSGVYVYVVKAGSYKGSKKIAVVK